jgi:flagellar biosynthesis protein FliR
VTFADSSPVILLLLLLRPAAALLIVGIALRLPVLVAAALAVCAAVFTAGIVQIDTAALAQLTAADTWLLAVKEIVLGLALGIIAALPIMVARTAASMVESASSEIRTLRYRALWAAATGVVFMAAQGPTLIIGNLAQSYQRIPMAIASGDLSGAGAAAASAAAASVSRAGSVSTSAPVAKLSDAVTSIVHLLSNLFTLALPMAVPLLTTAVVLSLSFHMTSKVGALAARRNHYQLSPVFAGITPPIMLVAVAATFSLAAGYLHRLVTG